MPDTDRPADPPFDIAVIGAGIVGAAITHFAAPHARVLWLEAEPAPGTQSTGRSAALYAPSYGPPQVRALTRASRAFFDAPPAGFAAVPLLRPRPSLFAGGEADEAALQALHRELCAETGAETGAECGAEADTRPGPQRGSARLIGPDEARALVPVLRAQACRHALLDPGSSDIDVDALLQGFVRGARAAGARFIADARVRGLRREGGLWHIATTGGGLGGAGSAPAGAAAASWHARCIVDAAGAWADELAALAGARRVGLQPKRRSAFLFEPPAGLATADWPAVVAADESWYFKPDAGLLLGSPANADPVHAHDVVAEELDVATGIHRIEEATTLQIRRPRSTWAGLRSFVADGEPVLGFDPQVPGFFWAAALGGYGIQSSPAVGRLCAAMLLVGLALQAHGSSAGGRTAAAAGADKGLATAAGCPGVNLAALSPARPTLA